MDIHPTSAVSLSIPDDLTIPEFFLDHESDPDRPQRNAIPCLVEDGSGRKINYEELRDRTNGLANALSSLYSIDYPVVIWAVHRLRAIVSPANPDFSRHELEFQLKATKAVLLIVHQDALDTAISAANAVGLPSNRILVLESGSAIWVSIIPCVWSQWTPFPLRKLNAGEGKTKLAFLSFSSGTTGTPKAVAIPHIAVIANTLQLAAHNKWEDRRYRPGDVAIGDIYGLLHYLLYCAMTIVVVPRFNFENMLKSIVKHRISHLMIVPPQAILLCKHPAMKKYNLNIIRYIMIGAAPLSDEINHRLFELFPDAHIGQGYGMTETCTVTTMWSAGQLVPGTVARVVKTDGSLGGYNDVGELVIKSPSNALGYHNNELATKETFINGWVKTGDEVKITPDGELWEIMKVRGFQVAPADLEGTILDHSDVADACVVGIPSSFDGESPMAWVQITADAAERVERDPRCLEEIRTSIIKHVADKHLKYKHLTGGVEFVDSIPKTPSGKLLRRVLRERAKELRSATKAKL
ncbi:hypothetical protein C8J57DRAFT_1430598 [Mycena rebaudengoi]|nr:hypothetical protein C8J57DRAFT_1430598 [Mycena rebaudengoi]